MSAAAAASLVEAEAVAAEAPCPFPGLRPFTEKEARSYFGREEQRDECIRRLQEHRFLAVMGASGSGKSSLVRAGVMHALSNGLLRGADERWHQVVLRPGADPMAALVGALGGWAARQRMADAPSATFDIEASLRSSSRGLAEVVAKLNIDHRNVLILVDQFEELFRLGKDRSTPQRWAAERAEFVRVLLGARGHPQLPVYLVITMRTDFLDDCTRYHGLADALNDGHFLVPMLTRGQLERAVAEPATRLGVPMSRALVRRVLGDALNVEDPLPTIQHALMRTWHERARRIASGQRSPQLGIDLSDYDAVGGAREALDRHGSDVLASLDEDTRRAAKIVFQRLTLTDADGKVTRSPASLRALVRLARAAGIPEAEPCVRRVLEAFRADDCRFIVPPADEPILDDSEIDISHEAVFRIWRELSGHGPSEPGWIAEEHADGRRYSHLVESARLKRTDQGQLLTEELLARKTIWWKQRSPTVEWVRRYHVPDEESQHIVESARRALAEIDRKGPLGHLAEREAVQREYRAALDAWHDAQFARARQHLEDSIEAKDEADRAARRMERKLLATRLLIVGAVILGMIAWIVRGERETRLRLELAARQAKEKTTETTHLLESAEHRANDAEERVRAAEQSARDAETRMQTIRAEADRAERAAAEKELAATKKIKEAEVQERRAQEGSQAIESQLTARQIQLERTNAQVQAQINEGKGVLEKIGGAIYERFGAARRLTGTDQPSPAGSSAPAPGPPDARRGL